MTASLPIGDQRKRMSSMNVESADGAEMRSSRRTEFGRPNDEIERLTRTQTPGFVALS